MVPAKPVRISDQTVTLPPLPRRVALASIVVAASIVTASACGNGPAPWRPPPILTVPPPVAPDALTVAPFRAMVLPVAVTLPPAWRRDDTSSRPVTVTSPPLPPPIAIEPLRPPIERAWTSPEILTALRAASRAVAAEMTTLPPSALIAPALLTSAPSPPAFVGAATWRKPSPEKSSVACSPEPRPTLPSGTSIEPEFDTVPPISAA